jgi:hypothetical protein
VHHRFKKLAGALAAVALAAGLTMAGTGTARADVVPPVGTWAEIFAPEINANGNTMCFDNSGSSAQFQSLQLWHCHGYASNGLPQRWTFVFALTDFVGRSAYRIGGPLGWCLGLDVRAPSYAQWQGSNIVQEACSGTVGSQVLWTLQPATQSPDPNNQFEIVSEDAPFGQHPYCVAANTFLDTNGNRLIAEPCDPYNSSQWYALG